MPNEFNDIIELALLGNKQAYGDLYDKTIQDVYRNVHFLIDDKSDVDDLIQEIYIQIYKSLSKYERDKKFRSWLMGIVINQIKTYRRKRWMNFRISKKAEEYGQIPEADFSTEIINNIANQQIIDLVNELPYKLKQVIILRYLNDYSQEEVGRILEIPLGTVKSRINAALNKLREKDNKLKLSEKVRDVYGF